MNSKTQMKAHVGAYSDTSGHGRFVLKARILTSILVFALTLLSSLFSRLSAQPISVQNKIDLTEAASSDFISYSISGMGTSQKVRLKIVNHQSISVEVDIEPGTELVPAEDAVQRLAVTRRDKIIVRGHMHNEPEVVVAKEINVACLDISLDAPSEQNKTWSVETNEQIRDFLTCVDKSIKDASQASPELRSTLSTMRPTLIQMGLWQARGAKKQEWIDFFVKYQNMDSVEAEQAVDTLTPLLDGIVADCGSLPEL